MINLFGMKIYESRLAEEAKPVRLLAAKDWHAKRKYPARIQKKWNKRFGVKRLPFIFQTPMGLFVHPSLMPDLRQAAMAPPSMRGDDRYDTVDAMRYLMSGMPKKPDSPAPKYPWTMRLPVMIANPIYNRNVC